MLHPSIAPMIWCCSTASHRTVSCTNLFIYKLMCTLGVVASSVMERWIWNTDNLLASLLHYRWCNQGLWVSAKTKSWNWLFFSLTLLIVSAFLLFFISKTNTRSQINLNFDSGFTICTRMLFEISEPGLVLYKTCTGNVIFPINFTIWIVLLSVCVVVLICSDFFFFKIFY